ncbi:MAG: GtrA family protein [Candidatus Obscuribacterales bacterium]|nr:GtrA family protein [Candidatus Obscuribacterales bacterium]
MDEAPQPTPKANPGELKRFLVAGGSAVACDTTVYWLLFAVLPPSVAKAISFIAGTIVAYILNKFWTFKKPKRSNSEVVKFICLYLTTLGANVAVNRLVLDSSELLGSTLQQYTTQIAFFAATGTSTVLNYLGQKFWVFKPADNS